MRKRKNGRNDSKSNFESSGVVQAYNTCEKKTAYDSKAEADQKGMRCYQCPFCGKWHKTSLKKRG